MAIGDATGGIAHNNKDIAEIIKNTSNDLSSAVGGLSAGDNIRNFFAGDGGVGRAFAGMDEKNIDTFIRAVESYRDGINATINKFDETAPMEEALKGSVATAFSEFIAALKKLLNSYVKAIDIEIKNIKEAKENYIQAAQSVSSDVSGDTGSVSSSASAVSID